MLDFSITDFESFGEVVKLAGQCVPTFFGVLILFLGLMELFFEEGHLAD